MGQEASSIQREQCTKACVQPQQQPIKLRLVTSANSTGPRDKTLQSLIGLWSSYMLAMHQLDLKHGRCCWSWIHEVQPKSSSHSRNFAHYATSSLIHGIVLLGSCGDVPCTRSLHGREPAKCGYTRYMVLTCRSDSIPTLAGVPRMRTRLRHR